jgi:aldose 1-epimerase
MIEKIVLRNEIAEVTLLSYGAGIYKYLFLRENIVITPKTVDEYMHDLTYYGKTIGRTSGRLVVPSYEINSKTYEVKPYRSDFTSLHGGLKGFSTQNFDVISKTDLKVVFRYVSEDLEEGYPGKLILDVTYELDNEGALHINYDALANKDTLCNITNHAYFNLNQTYPTILDHEITIKASKYLNIDKNYLLKSVDDVENTPFDFRNSTTFRERVNKMHQTSFYGFDHTWIFDDLGVDEIKAKAYDPKSNIGLDVYTSYPAVVVYTHNDPAIISLEGPFDQDAIHSSFTFECQFEPGGIHHKQLNHAILKKDEPYHQFITFKPYKK